MKAYWNCTKEQLEEMFGFREKGLTEEELYRGLVFSNLITIHQKTGIGRLSAFCGAVSAGCASGAAITYLEGGTLEQINKTVTNKLNATENKFINKILLKQFL